MRRLIALLCASCALLPAYAQTSADTLAVTLSAADAARMLVALDEVLPECLATVSALERSIEADSVALGVMARQVATLDTLARTQQVAYDVCRAQSASLAREVELYQRRENQLRTRLRWWQAGGVLTTTILLISTLF